MIFAGEIKYLAAKATPFIEKKRPVRNEPANDVLISTVYSRPPFLYICNCAS
jgi:hypothetical protein